MNKNWSRDPRLDNIDNIGIAVTVIRDDPDSPAQNLLNGNSTAQLHAPCHNDSYLVVRRTSSMSRVGGRSMMNVVWALMASKSGS